MKSIDSTIIYILDNKEKNQILLIFLLFTVLLVGTFYPSLSLKLNVNAP